MPANNQKENESAESKSSTPVTPEEVQAHSDDEQESLEMGAEPGTPITVGGDGSPL